MRAAGYVLVGGRSSRMGTDKALLPYENTTMAVHVALKVLAAAGSVTLVGDRSKYAHLGFPVIADRLPGNGPLGGVAAAVQHCEEWALVTACDMPDIEASLLEQLVQAARDARPSIECVVPVHGGETEPLCALYHRKSLPLLDSFLNEKFLAMRDVVASLQSLTVSVPDALSFRNVNTPQEFRAHE